MIKEINGFPRYFITDDGRVISGVSGKQLKTVDNHGYSTVTIGTGKNKKKKRVHRLVASAFCKREEGQTDVNHIDGNKKNNRATNLEWCTKSENMFHAYKNGLRADNKKVICLDDGMVFNSPMDAARYYNMSHQTIRSCCIRASIGKTRTFRFIEECELNNNANMPKGKRGWQKREAYKIKYQLEKDGVVHKFDSETDACKFANVSRGSVSAAWKLKARCKGYVITRLGA